MENKTNAISSAATSFQLVNNRMATNSVNKKRQPKLEQNSISDSLETSDGDSGGGAQYRNPDSTDAVRPDNEPDSKQTGSILDISG